MGKFKQIIGCGFLMGVLTIQVGTAYAAEEHIECYEEDIDHEEKDLEDYEGWNETNLEEETYDITQGEDYKRLEKIILSIKERFDVPDSFRCTNLEWMGNEEWGEEEWEIYWRDPKDGTDDSRWMRVTFTEKGQVIQYFTNYYDAEKEGKVTLTNKEAYEKALEYLKEKGGYDLESLKYIEKEEEQGLTYKEFKFQYYKNGIPVYDEDVSIGIYMTTGRVVLMNGLSSFSGEYIPLENIISLEQAKSEFANKIPLQPMYFLDKDQSGHYIQKLYWYLFNPYDYCIQAMDGSRVISKINQMTWEDIDGNLIEPLERLLHYEKGPFIEEVITINDSVEMQKYIEDNHLLDTTQVVEEAGKYFPMMKRAIIEKKSLVKGEGKTYWEMEVLACSKEYKGTLESFKKAYEKGEMDYGWANSLEVICDASTGEVLLYNNKNLPAELHFQDEIFTEEQMKEVEHVLKRLNPTDWGKVDLLKKHNYPTSYHQYVQLIDNLPVPYYGYSLTYNHNEKEIVHYAKHIYQGPVVSDAKALTREDIASRLNLQLGYIIISNEKAVPVYSYYEKEAYFE